MHFAAPACQGKQFHLQASSAWWNAQACKAVMLQQLTLALVQTKSYALLRQLLAEPSYPGKGKEHAYDLHLLHTR